MTDSGLDFRAVGRQVSNWGRWGDDDEIGTLNLSTPESVLKAAKLIRKGRTFALGIPFEQEGPQDGKIRPNPMRMMRETGALRRYPGAMRYADDYVFMALQAATQWDALAHVFYDDQLYNGFPASSITEDGAAHCGLDGLFEGVAGRAVLLDVARHRGVPWLPAGVAISPDELDEVAQAQPVDVRAGDIVLVRTGWIEKFFTDRDQAEFKGGEPGLSFACATWLRERDVMAIAADNYAVEVIPHEIEGEAMPLHMVLIRDMGMLLGEMFDLSQLAADCDEDGIYEVFLCAPPIKFPRAAGSPINPMAIK